MRSSTRRQFRRGLGWVGLAFAAPLLVWLPLGLLPAVPSMIEVFGLVGLRAPASVAVAGLLLAAIGFHET